jgi:hypothetical protein
VSSFLHLSGAILKDKGDIDVCYKLCRYMFTNEVRFFQIFYLISCSISISVTSELIYFKEGAYHAVDHNSCQF